MSSAENVYMSAQSAQDRYDAELERLPFVSGHAVGEFTDEKTSDLKSGLEIFVFEEQHKNEVALRDLIVKIEKDNVPVRVTVLDFRFTPLQPIQHGSADLDVLVRNRTDKFDPIIGGVSCGPDVNILIAGWRGTLGLVVHRLDAKADGLLSNAHVFCYKNTTSVCQPARVDSWLNYVAGTDLIYCKGNWNFAGRDVYVDAAVATVKPSRGGTRGAVFGVPTPLTAVKPWSSLRVGNPVSKSGLTTGVTDGTIKYFSGTAGSAKNQIVVAGASGTAFSAPGDSGSIVYAGNEVVGLLWGGVNDTSTDLTVITPIEAVFDALNISL